MKIVDICNIALSRIGVAPISSTSEQSAQANHCRVFFDLARDSALRAHEWNFATAQIQLTEVATNPFYGWGYCYEYPPNCVKVRKVGTAEIFIGADPANFAVLLDDKLGKNRIVSDQEDAYCEYTVQVINSDLFDALFVDALAWRLAAELAIPLRGDPSLQKQAFQNFLAIVSQAQATDANTQKKKSTASTGTNPYVEARQ